LSSGSQSGTGSSEDSAKLGNKGIVIPGFINEDSEDPCMRQRKKSMTEEKMSEPIHDVEE
jgi:hypothetical protein